MKLHEAAWIDWNRKTHSELFASSAITEKSQKANCSCMLFSIARTSEMIGSNGHAEKGRFEAQKGDATMPTDRESQMGASANKRSHL